MGKKRTKEFKDIVEKNFEAYPDVAADVINALLYDGEQLVEAGNLLPAPTETVYQGTERLRNQYQDLTEYEVLAGQLNMVYQFANQSGMDSRMPLRKASYVGAAYGEQYAGKVPVPCPVAELLLYWGRKPWNSSRSLHGMFRRRKLPKKAWEYIDDVKLHVWEMRRLSPEVRERFRSDMRIVVDYLAEGTGYRSDRPVRHKEALIKMIRVLSGENNVEDTAEFLRDAGIREEDEVTMCELFEQYERRGRKEGLSQGRRQGLSQGIQAAIAICKELGATFEVTAEKIREQFKLSDKEVQSNMKLYW